jgi:hypothetical protein
MRLLWWWIYDLSSLIPAVVPICFIHVYLNSIRNYHPSISNLFPLIISHIIVITTCPSMSKYIYQWSQRLPTLPHVTFTCSSSFPFENKMTAYVASKWWIIHKAASRIVGKKLDPPPPHIWKFEMVNGETLNWRIVDHILATLYEEQGTICILATCNKFDWDLWILCFLSE